MTILAVFGTRPEAIKLFPVIAALRDAGMPVRTCATGQHRALLDQVLAAVGLVPDDDLDLMTPGQSLDALAARLLTGIGEVLDHVQPTRVLVQGDTATAMAGALAAYHRRIPVAHVEAGLRSGDIGQPWPEEVNRRIVASIADLHFAPTDTAATALKRENVAGAIHVTGNSVIDALHAMRRRLDAEPALAAALDPVVSQFAGRRMLLVTAHRRENLGAGMAAIGAAIAELAARHDVAVIFPVHPNPEVAGTMSTLADLPNVALTAPLDYPCFVRALSLCDIVLTDSGGVQEEAPAFGKPVLVMRDTTERPEGIAAGTARLVGTDTARIVAAASALLDDPAAYAAMARAHSPFGDGHAGERIAAILRRPIAAGGRHR